MQEGSSCITSPDAFADSVSLTCPHTRFFTIVFRSNRIYHPFICISPARFYRSSLQTSRMRSARLSPFSSANFFARPLPFNLSLTSSTSHSFARCGRFRFRRPYRERLCSGARGGTGRRSGAVERGKTDLLRRGIKIACRRFITASSSYLGSKPIKRWRVNYLAVD